MNLTITEDQAPETDIVPAKGAIKFLAHFFSVIFHPIFIPIYVFGYLVYLHPTVFAGFSQKQQHGTMFIALLNLVFFPLFSVVLLKAVGFIDSIYLRTQKDRIIPYIAIGIFYFWAYTVFKEQAAYHRIIPAFVLGIFLASSAALIANIYFKISMHGIGAGGLLGFFIVLLKQQMLTMAWPLAVVLLIVGLICSSRLLLGAHRPGELYAGVVLGLICQFVGAYVLL